MPEYQRTTVIDADPSELFDYLSKVENLPSYFAGVTEARHRERDDVHVVAAPQPDEAGPPQRVESDAWFQVDAERTALSWGAEGPHDYHGELLVSRHDDGAQVAVTLHTQHESENIVQAIDDTLENIRALVVQGRAG